MNLSADDPQAVAFVEAVRAGDVAAVERLLAAHDGLATARFVDPRCGDERSTLHVATDWPGHFPNGRAVVARLIAAGADVDAAFGGRHAERPLHWAASSDDVGVLDALVEAGADIEAPGSVINGGSPLADAVAFGQWRAARRLVELGAQVNLWQAAALGLADRLEELLEADPPPMATRSPTRSGARATAVSGSRRSDYSTAAPTSTGSATTDSPRSTRRCAAMRTT